MNREIWKIIFEGKLFEGHKPDIVKKRLASLIKMDLVKIERLFQGGQVILKSGIDYQGALKFQAAFQRTGAKCRIIRIEEVPLEAEKSIETTSPRQDSFKRDTSSTSPYLSTDNVLGAFKGNIDPVEVSRSYKIGLSIAGISMALLPLLYIALIIMIGCGIYYHATENINVIIQMGIWVKLVFLPFVYLAPLVFGTILILFMIKPFLAPHPTKAMSISLNPYKEVVLFDLVHRISEIVDSPMPRRIEIDCHVHSSARFDIGLISLFEEDLVLKFGLPLAAGLNTRQFTGVLAHELGHFSQVGGSRLTFIIRSINLWFSRIVYDRDIWDEKLKKWSEEGNAGIRTICNIARFFVWITRKIIWIFMKTGHLISHNLIRKMEFNADRFQTRVAGSKQFADTCLRLNTMDMVSEKASADLRKLRNDRRLVNNLPALIMSNIDKISPLTEAHFRRHIMESKTGFFDALPSDRDRIISALKENTEGIFSLEVPVRLLFSDFDNLSREATIDYYRNEIDLTLTDDDLIAPHAFTGNKDDPLHGHDAVERYFIDDFSVLRSLPIQPIPVIRKKPARQRVDSLLKALYSTKKMAPKMLEVMKNYERALEKALTIQNVKLLQQNDLSIDTQGFQLIGGNKEGSEKTLKKALSEKSAADSLLRKVEGLFAARYGPALSLLGAPAISRHINGAEGLKKEAETLLNTYLSFSSAIAFLDKLSRTYVSITSLLFNILDNQDNEVLAEIIQKMKTACKGHLTDSYNRLRNIPYPFDHAQENMSVAEYMMENDPEGVDEGAILEICESAIDKIFSFNSRLLGRLAVIAGAVEKVVLSMVQKKVSSQKVRG